MKKEFKPSKKTAEALAWACELLKRAYDNGEANGGSVDWEDLDLADAKAREALKLAKREGYIED